MSSALQATLPRSWDAVISQKRFMASAGLVILALAWPVFVFTGSQASYLVALVAACATAAALAATRSSLVVGYIAGLMALVGPEASGQLGNGHAPLGSLRLLDAATAAVAATVLFNLYVSRQAPIVWRRRLGPLSLLSMVAVGYATLRWVSEGHLVNGFLRTDLRLIVLAALFWLIVSHCRRGGAQPIFWCLVVVGLLAALKAVAIHISGLYAIGSNDRLQATSLYTAGHLRTILVGGDTLLVLVPTVAILLASVQHRHIVRIGLVLAALICVWALGLSATRTSVLVALGLMLVAVVAILVLAHKPLSRLSITAGLILAMLVAGVAMIGGAATRLTQDEGPNAGLNFRKDEVDTFLHTSAGTKYLGQGLGGSFSGTNPIGKTVPTGWAHELPVWIALKAGILGLVCALLALAAIFRRTMRALQREDERIQVLVGAIFVLGLVVMSMTLDRLALPEGLLPFMVGVFLISSAVPHAAGSSA
jgi:hypothetical protein